VGGGVKVFVDEGSWICVAGCWDRSEISHVPA
jgi:hypothetical protein